MTPRFFLLGDSHMAAICVGRRLLDLPGVGRPVMQAMAWDRGEFDALPDGDIRLHSRKSGLLLNGALEAAGVRRLTELEIPVVTTVPFGLHCVMDPLEESHSTAHGRAAGKPFLSSAFLREVILARRRRVIDALARLSTPSRPVIAVSSPPRGRPAGLAQAIEDIIATELRRVGIQTLVTREWAADEDGLLRPEFLPSDRPDDVVHANGLYGVLVLDKLAPLLGIERDSYEEAFRRATRPLSRRPAAEVMRELEPEPGTAG